MKTQKSILILLLFVSVSLVTCNEFNANNSFSCIEPALNEPYEPCNDVISSETLIIGEKWESKTKNNEFALVFKENNLFAYTSKKENIYNENSYLLDPESYKISISWLGCSGSGIYSYSIAYKEDHSQIAFKEEKDECTERKNILLSNNWKRIYQS